MKELLIATHKKVPLPTNESATNKKKVPRPLNELATPCLLLSMDALERNEVTMRKRMLAHNISLRPHAKAHKSSQLAAWHIEQSRHTPLAGFCAQTIVEAEMLVRAGATDILITNNLAPHAATKLARLAAAHPFITFGTLVDCDTHVAVLKAAAFDAGARLKVLVEIECGMDRCGVLAGSEASVRLANSIISAAPELEWGGIHVYAGNLGQVQSMSARKTAVVAAVGGPVLAARKTVARFTREGISVPCITGGGTGTNTMDIAAGVHTELQPGSYLLMDGNYSKNEGNVFAQALHVHATCISSNDATGKRIVDAGSKAVDVLGGMPAVTSIVDAQLATLLANVVYSEGGCEHGILRNVPSGVLNVGETVQLIPSDLYSTVNRHACLVGVRDSNVERIFTIDGRYSELSRL